MGESHGLHYTADAQQLTPQLASKFNVLKGPIFPIESGTTMVTFREFLKC